MAFATPALTKLSHPALLTDHVSPPLTPLSPTIADSLHKHRSVKCTSTKLQPPAPSYAMLRAHHAYALKYTIAKLRWDQVNNLYLPGQDADWNHVEMVNKLEKELHNVEEAQKGFDRFPNCFAPIAFPKTHGPLTKEKYEETKRIEFEKEKKLMEELEKHYSPILRKLFIGPMTKLQYKRDQLLRRQLREDDLEEISMLIPTENKKFIMAQQEQKAAQTPYKKSYEQQRYEKEKAKIAANLEAIAKEKGVIAEKQNSDPKKRIGPITKEEWMSTLPIYGPKTYAEAMLPKQRAQRHDIISWLQRPWGVYNEKASKAMEALAELAKEGLEEERVLREKLKKKKDEIKKVEELKEDQPKTEAEKIAKGGKEDKEGGVKDKEDQGNDKKDEGKDFKDQGEDKKAEKEDKGGEGQDRRNEKDNKKDHGKVKLDQGQKEK